MSVSSILGIRASDAGSDAVPAQPLQSLAKAVRLQPAHPDAKNNHRDQHQRQADPAGQCPHGASVVVLVGHHEVQRLAEIEDHHQQHHHQRDFVDGIQVKSPNDFDGGSIATCGNRTA